MKSARASALNAWARDALEDLGIATDPGFELVSASDDASFRRYFRGLAGGRSFVFVDAPPQQEDSRPFIDIASRLVHAGLNAPVVYRHDVDKGFMMLTDFGNRLYLDALMTEDDPQVEALYQDAFASIVKMQQMQDVDGLPDYDERLLREEMNLFVDWFLPKQLSIDLDRRERDSIDTVFDMMVSNALAQPSVFVHRDYHSRNLMVLEKGGPGIIDFQDAVLGPVTYDLVSLLRDCYFRFPVATVERWTRDFRERLVSEGVMDDIPAGTFSRWFDWMGMQRHLKCAGIFSRLNLRDGKPRYLSDIPLVVDYILEVCDRYQELADFGDWLRERVVPMLVNYRAD